MPNPVAHFEIYGDNPEKLASFYQKLFNWEISTTPQTEGYWLIKTVATDAKGAHPHNPAGSTGG